MNALLKLTLYTAGLAIVFVASFTAAHLLIPAEWSASWELPMDHSNMSGDSAGH
ncbi:hypothetical protein ACFQB0_08050 [Luethyella okanaganae]|uniref:Uncharacterized protein n=2 Tax=Luethyella okanaganae TaxID=69372 RepID=A0ABW1VG32_9MICO